MNALALVGAKVALGSALALGLAVAPHGVAHTTFASLEPDHDVVDTINLSELPTIDELVVCHEEDGSDVTADALPCVWHSPHGDDYLTFETYSLRIIDEA